MKTAYIALGLRTPFAKAGTELKDIHAAELGRFALAELLGRTGLPLQELSNCIDEVVIGNTGTPSDTANISRVVALRAGLSQKIPAHTVHRNCASAMESIAEAAIKIEAGYADVIVAGGTESMSNMPLLYNSKMVAFFDKLSRAKSAGDKLRVLTELPIKDVLKPRIAIVEGLTDPVCSLNMGQTAELLAKEFKISRQRQDEFALQSHQRAVEAQEAGRFKEEIAPYAVPPRYEKILTVDSGPRKNQTFEALQKLKPYFDRKHGTVTVGNACPITDGAAMMFICSEEGLKKLGDIKPLAKIRGAAFAGLEPERMGLGPVFATHKLLSKIGMKLSDFGVFEINEAFACQVIACMMAFDSDAFCRDRFGLSAKMGAIDPAKLNANGGAIAIGHPVGTTGTRLVLTAALEMRRRKESHALASLCIGGGQGGAVALEAV